MGGNGGTPPKKVMVVADPTRESAGALQYALAHAVFEDDELILLHVDNPNSWKNTFATFLRKPSGTFTFIATEGGTGSAGVGAGAGGRSGSAGEVDFLEDMKRACKISKPGLRVRSERIELPDGRDKASLILNQTLCEGIDLLVIGQRKNLSTLILRSKKNGGSLKGIKSIDTAEYLIENSKCTCVGVLKKPQGGGYLLNSKTHKNFWLLA